MCPDKVQSSCYTPLHAMLYWSPVYPQGLFKYLFPNVQDVHARRTGRSCALPHSIAKAEQRDFPGDPVVKTLRSQCWGPGPDPWVRNPDPRMAQWRSSTCRSQGPVSQINKSLKAEQNALPLRGSQSGERLQMSSSYNSMWQAERWCAQGPAEARELGRGQGSWKRIPETEPWKIRNREKRNTGEGVF